ncbi:hypothetical protein Pse7367_2541 [Thalassoporum mexicanum PCC 7367]|uniref:TIGR03032 family protein n=1 Tax=Thalassoporum mexicanum TaxID=3457544 RepID=UPI00029FE5A4|nr:TIGR03032 family protein [Pseudanabaena sp. PCC 7367]AFY70801.1 hypothetical protein Pse7367_2541 [Pseudanabaena sp. PCC 7367]
MSAETPNNTPENPENPDNPAESPLRSIHTSNFPQILSQLGISLAVTTYQAGKIIIVRADGENLNTHFRVFKKPMGMAMTGNQLSLGSGPQIINFRNMPNVAQKLDPPDKHDACYLPYSTHITGDIDIHEMAYGEDGLWFVNTRFSCLCTLDRQHSFVPRWRPAYVTALAPEDRCHLNGLAMVDGKPKYVTALGETDMAGGWRQNKVNGGVLMDVESKEVLLRGLSMPHSPRRYGDRTWLLESGYGSISQVDLNNGSTEMIAQMPGFTRGLDFCGNLAFIGLSQVRETAVFSGVPITEKASERNSGVWVVNLTTGQIVAFLKFEDMIQEVFAVQVLPQIKFPEIIDHNDDLLASSYFLPPDALSDVPKRLISS